MSSRVKTRLGGQGKYSPEQVDATLKLIDELPVTGSPAYGLTLHTYRVRNNLVPEVVA